MALIKPNYPFKGLNVPNAYLRISNLEYLYNQKKVAYLVSVYANKSISQSEEETRLDDYYVGITDMPLGGSVPDILRMIYEDIKMKARDADSYPEIAEKFADCIDDVLSLIHIYAEPHQPHAAGSRHHGKPRLCYRGLKNGQVRHDLSLIHI